MKVKKKPMPMWQKIFYVISFIFLIWAFIYLGTKNYNAPQRELTEFESFTKEYGITSQNVFKYTTAKEVLEMMNTKEALIFMAFPENKWSSKYAEILNDTAERLGIKEIYYYNFKNDRSNNNHYYENIVKELSSYVPYLDNDNSDIYAPTLIGVKDGNIVFYDDETSIIHGDVSIDDYWTNDKIASKMVNLGILLQKYLGEDDEKTQE